jgi:2-methylcitrate dehydratase
MATIPSTTVLTPWIEQALQTRFTDLPASMVELACGRVLDSIGCAMGAWPSEPGQIARTVASRLQPTPAFTSRLWGSLQPTVPEWASFANGILVRYLDFNDTYLSKEPAHPSDNIPALVAVAEQVGASGQALITAIVLSYELQCRLCDAFSIRKHGWDHVNYGSLSVALGASYLLNLTPEQTHQAISLAITGHVAMRQTRVGELSHWKGCAFANSARNAVVATYLAQAGMTGPREVIEGEMGFMAQLSQGKAGKGDRFDWPSLKPDGHWMIERTYIKHYPAEYHSQSAIELALDLRQPLNGDASQVEKIHIDTFDAAADIIAGFPEHWCPKSRETADHSMPYCVTVALLDGDITLASFDQAKREDPTVLALLQTVTVARDAALTARYPYGIPNRITLSLKNGQTLTGNPMTPTQIADKFHKLAAPYVSADKAEAMAQACWQLPQLANVAQLVDRLSWG